VLNAPPKGARSGHSDATNVEVAAKWGPTLLKPATNADRTGRQHSTSLGNQGCDVLHRGESARSDRCVSVLPAQRAGFPASGAALGALLPSSALGGELWALGAVLVDDSGCSSLSGASGAVHGAAGAQLSAERSDRVGEGVSIVACTGVQQCCQFCSPVQCALTCSPGRSKGTDQGPASGSRQYKDKSPSASAVTAPRSAALAPLGAAPREPERAKLWESDRFWADWGWP
jgi:hypothetical protein